VLVGFRVGEFRPFSRCATTVLDNAAQAIEWQFARDAIDFARGTEQTCNLIHGPNASGKTSLLRTLASLRIIFAESALEMLPGKAIAVSPFRYDKASFA